MSKKIRNIALSDSALIDVRDCHNNATPLIDYVKLILKDLNVSYKDEGTCEELFCSDICPPDIDITYDEETHELCITVGDSQKCLELELVNTVTTENCNGLEFSGTGTELDPLTACLVVDPNPCNLISVGEDGLLALQVFSASLEDGVITFDFGCEETDELDISGLYEFENGLTLVGNAARLGGNLIVDTTIDLDGNRFTLTGDEIVLTDFPNTRDDSGDVTPENFLYTDENGQLFSASLSFLTRVRNGLSLDDTYIELGGSLLHDTSITGAYDLSIENTLGVGISAPFNGTFRFGVYNDDTSVNSSVYIINTQAPKNSADSYSFTATRNVSGGAFTQSTAGNLYGGIVALTFNNTGNVVLLEDGHAALVGALSLVATANVTTDLLSGVSGNVNFLENGDYVRVASITANAPFSTVSGSYNSFSGNVEEYISLLVRSNDRNKDIGDTGSADKTYGIFQEGDVSNFFEGQVYIGNYGDPEDPTTLATYPNAEDRPRLNVQKTSSFTPDIGVNAGSISSLALAGAGADAYGCDLYTGLLGIHFWEFDADKTIRAESLFSGITGTAVVESDYDLDGGIVSSLAAVGIFTPQTAGTKGTTEGWAGLRIRQPQQAVAQYSAGKVYDELINAYGVYINNLQADPYLPVTNSWGIYQVGSTDINYFAAKVGIGTNAPHASAKVDITSTTQGLSLPNMTTTQRNAIASPKGGLLIYNTTTEEVQYYKASISTWVAL